MTIRRTATLTSTIVREASVSNEGNAGGSDFNDDIFEDCHFTNGHEEQGCLNDGQGVNKTPGAYIEASTTIAGKRSGPSSGSRPTTPTLGPGQKTASVHPKGPNLSSLRRTSRQNEIPSTETVPKEEVA